jgi:calcineurin-like phosphoesterase family protein
MLNFKEEDKIFVISDSHIHHDRDFVWKTRGFSSVKEHDDAVIGSINDKVKPDDFLIHLGDLCLNTTLSQFEEIISRINCKNVYMLFGNHPNPHYKNIYVPMVKQLLGSNYTADSEVYPLRYKNIVYIGHYAEVVLGRQFAILSHYPIYIWNEMSHGAWMLCGHSHYGCDFSKAENLGAKILDVGWDGHLGPWSFKEIKAVMDKKTIPVVDHHK